MPNVTPRIDIGGKATGGLVPAVVRSPMDLDAVTFRTLVRRQGIVLMPGFEASISALLELVAMLDTPAPPWDPFAVSKQHSLVQEIEVSSRPAVPVAKTSSQYWHSDVAFSSRPPNFTAILCLRNSKEGGETEFCDMRTPLSKVGEQTRSVLRQIDVLHSFAERLGPLMAEKYGKSRIAVIEQKFPPVWQPLIRCQVATPAAALFASPLSAADYRSPSSPTEVQTAINQTMREAVDQSAVYVHRWSPHDLLVWDNSVIMHRRALTRVVGDRLHWRVSTSGTPVKAFADREGQQTDRC